MINYREEEKRILDEILGKGVYDNRIRPSGTNGTGICVIFGSKLMPKQNRTAFIIWKISFIRFKEI